MTRSARALAVLVVVFVALLVAGSAGADVSGVTVSVDSPTAGDLAATWTFTFTATASLDGNLGDDVTVTFPSGIDVSGADGGALTTGFSGTCSFPPPPTIASGQSVQLILPAGCSLASSTPATVTMTGINPPAGTYPAAGFTVSTSQETTAVAASGSDVVIGSGGGGGGGGNTQVSGVSFTPSKTGTGQSGGWTVAFTSSSSGALVGGIGFGYVEVALPSGFGAPTGASFGSGFVCTGGNATAPGFVVGNTYDYYLPTGCRLGDSSAGVLTLDGVTNPSTAATYSGATVATSADVTPVAGNAVTITAATYALTVSTAGTGSGTVTSEPAGIDCGSTCTHDFSSGASVTLTAKGATGSTFAGWSGCSSSSGNSCTVTMSRARSVTATFTRAAETLTVSESGTGSGTVTSEPAGIDCGSTCSHDFSSGASVILTAKGATGSTFAGWSGCSSSSGNSCTVTMSRARAVKATFTRAAETLTVSSTGTGSGTVTSEPAGIDCGSTCSHDFSSGASVILTAKGATGSTFAGWSGCPNISGKYCMVTMDQARSVTAKFVLECVPPKVEGEKPAAAKQALKDAHCAVGKTGEHSSKTVDRGRVIKTKPGVGETLTAGTEVDLVVSSGPACVVPDFEAWSPKATQAFHVTQALKKAHCAPGAFHFNYSDRVPHGVVIKSKPGAGKKRTGGTKVDIFYSEGPAPPANKTLPTISGTPIAGQTLTGSPGTWSESPTHYNYVWLICPSPKASRCKNPQVDDLPASSPGDSYQPRAGDVGSYVVLKVWAFSHGYGISAYSTATAAVQPPPPAVSVPPRISGEPKKGDRLTAHRGTWDHGPTSYRYQWRRCDSTGARCAPINGATGRTYVPTDHDAGHTLRVRVWASNAGGTSLAATSAHSRPVAATVSASETKTVALRPGQTRTMDVRYPFALRFRDARYSCSAKVSLPRGVTILSRGSAQGGSVCRVKARNTGRSTAHITVTATTVH